MSTAKDRRELRESKRQTRALKDIAATAARPDRPAPGPEGTADFAHVQRALQTLSGQIDILVTMVMSTVPSADSEQVPIGGMVRRRNCPDCGNQFNKGLEEQTTDTAPHEVTKHQLECDNGHIWRVTVERVSPRDWVV